MINILKTFIFTVIIITFLIITQTSITNIIWLYSVDMPVTFYLVISNIFYDLFGMNFNAAIPTGIIGLVAIGLALAFFITRIVLIWVNIDMKYAYAIAGGAAVAAIILLMPLAFYNLDLIAGARSLAGKSYLIASGILGGYFFGSNITIREV